MRVGEKLVLFNGCDAKSPRKSSILAAMECTEKIARSGNSALQCRIVLGQAIPKGKTWTDVQKVSRIGAAKCADHSDRTIVLSIRKRGAKTVQMQQIAVEAANNAVRTGLPHVHAPRKLSDCFPRRGGIIRLQLIGSSSGCAH